jgi:hypothetical protein
MKLAKRGKSISTIDINLTQFGMWLYLSDEEFFLSYEDYPFFKTATVDDIYQVELHHKNHLYWPNLDVDLSVDILKNPHHFPLLAH